MTYYELLKWIETFDAEQLNSYVTIFDNSTDESFPAVGLSFTSDDGVFNSRAIICIKHQEEEE